MGSVGRCLPVSSGSSSVSFEPPAVHFIPSLKTQRHAENITTRALALEPGGLCDVPAESFSNSQRIQLSAFGFLQLLSIPQCAE